MGLEGAASSSPGGFPKKRKKEKTIEGDYKHDPAPQSGPEWREWRQRRKDLYRKWKEEKLIKSLEKAKRSAEASEKAVATDGPPVKGGRASSRCTLTVALPGSALDVAPSAELRTHLAGQLARAMAVFCVDEVVVYDDGRTLTRNELGDICPVAAPASSSRQQNACMLLSKVLLYLECPLYLRKALFPPQQELQFAGLLIPLATPHHLQATDTSKYREGIVLNKPVKPGKGSFVNIGLNKECQIDKCLQPGVRVTVELADPSSEKRTLKGKAVSPSAPLLDSGLYWGYQVRVATSLSKVFAECPFDGGYDVKIAAVTASTDDGKGHAPEELDIPPSKHCVVVFSSSGGFGQAIENDDDLPEADVSSLFHAVVDPCPNRGCKGLRIEEAVLVLLSSLKSRLRAGARVM